MSAMPLPQALKPWHDWLSWFAPELQEALGRMLQQLHPMLGPLHAARRGEVPEPGGVDDLHRRGRYERLLSSEWLLATDLPDEFLRRAATGEHLFLAPRQVSQRAQRSLVAVFDAGPLQWGAPRLAHIALWILLARRASQAGGQLRWAIAQQPHEVHDARSEDDLRRLLAARTFAPLAHAQWTRWAEALDSGEDGAAEYWFVGHDVAAPPRSGRCPTHTVQLRRGLRGDVLDVTTCVHGTVRILPLPLPPQGSAPQLLKGRFRDEPAPPPAPSSALQLSDRFSLQARPLVASNGSRVAVRLLEGHGMLVFTIPTEPGRPARKPKRQQWGAQAEPLAAAFGGSGLGALLHLPQALQFWQVPRFHAQPPQPPRELFEAPPGRGRLLPMAWYNDPVCARIYVLDPGHRLVYWQVSTTGSVRTCEGPQRLDSDVFAMSLFHDQELAYVCRAEGRFLLRTASRSGRDSQVVRLGPAPTDTPEVLLATGQRWREHGAAVGIRLSEDGAPQAWRVHESVSVTEPAPFWDIGLAAGARVVGLLPPGKDRGSALVVQAPDRCGLLLQTQHGQEPLYRAPSQFDQVSVCGRSGLVALVTRDRQLHVLSGHDKSLRLVVHGRGEEARDAAR